ncbi:hypothetical protein [Pseudomonas sp. B10(2017)]|uniref:hypothetical protein n=1 Tax=Pseudomonas sp. B10(2017) TaxID=1981749 RepID=UPI0011798C7E|nr:hypothetical protein [Pseudomonas sp. B10(2017)]
MNSLHPLDINTHKNTLANGSSEVSFIYKNTKCPLLELTDERAITCNLNQLVIKDFEKQLIPTLQLAIALLGDDNTQQSCELTYDNPTSLVVGSLINSSVVTHSKITTSSLLRGKDNLYLLHIKEHLNEQEIKTHVSVKHMRDKWIAHLDENPFETAKTLLVFDPSQTSLPALAHHVSFQSVRLSPAFLPNFLSLAEKVLTIIQEKQKKTPAQSLKSSR